MKSTQLYDFTLAANSSQVILADANFYKILTATGDVAITRDGGSTVRPMRAGRGEREVDFQRLTIRDISGAPNSGTIVVGDSNFIDDTIVLSSAINVRPESASGFWSDNSTAAANTAITVFTPASNTGGVILLTASAVDAVGIPQAFIAKASAPTTVIDGEVITYQTSSIGVASGVAISLQQAQLIPAGKGLYFISGTAGGAGWARAARWKNL